MINVTRPLVTIRGEPVELLTINGRNPDFPLVGYVGKSQNITMWTMEGENWNSDAQCQLVNAPEEVVVRFINLYSDGSHGCHKTVKTAKMIAIGSSRSNPCIARKRVEFTHGTFEE